MMELEQICGGYGGVPVLRNITADFPRGSVTTLIGTNGCGKTTLLKIAARLLLPTSGRVLLAGKPISAYSRKEFAQKVAVLPQSRELPAITVEALVAHGRYPYLKFPRSPSTADKAQMEEAMRETGVLDLRARELRTLSGGQRQKAYLAMAVAQDTDVIFLDEPTTYLDVGRQFEMLELVRRLNERGKTIVMVLHDLAHSLRFSDRILLLQNGSVRAALPPDDLFASGLLDEVFDVRGHAVSRKDGTDYYFTHR